jgi:hypothetical protein
MTYAYQVLLSDSELGALVVLEDAAEFVMANNRGPGVARLLNLADGLLGQGVRVVFLLTTNENIGEIDPALQRPGRCRQVLEFPKFTPEQAASWLGAPKDVMHEVTLAELYNNRFESITSRVGF